MTSTTPTKTTGGTTSTGRRGNAAIHLAAWTSANPDFVLVSRSVR